LGAERSRALLFAPEAPYPLSGGGALRTASILHYLSHRYDLDLLTFLQPGDARANHELPAGLVHRFDTIDLPVHRTGPAARIFRNSVRLVRRVPPLIDRFAGFEHKVDKVLSGRRYEIGVIEHFWCAPYRRSLSQICARTVLNLHNIESVLHERCGSVEGDSTRFAHRIFARAAWKLERDLLPGFSEILAPSPEDAALVRARAPAAHVTVYPNAIPLQPVPLNRPQHVIVFSGNLEYHPNVTAVRFFRQQVWPELRQRWPQLVWRLVGRNPDAVRRWTAGDARIECTGPVPDATVELARAQVAVVPLLAGSGTRLKILEAWSAARPVVSTSLGAEGLPVKDGYHLLLADNAPDFAAAVSRLLNDAELRGALGNAGRELLENGFTWEKAWKNLSL